MTTEPIIHVEIDVESIHKLLIPEDLRIALGITVQAEKDME